MIKSLQQRIVWFILLVFVQVAILNHIYFLGYINPMLYILFIILYPLRKEKASFLIISFLLGLTIDLFSNSGGINAAASLFIAFVRMPILKSILKKTDIDLTLFNIRKTSFTKSITYIATLTFVHHFIIFSLSYFNWGDISTILYRTFATGIFTIILCLITIALFIKNK